MKTARIWGTTIISIILLVSLTYSVLAIEAPTFPSCLNPQGTLKVKYGSGVHGIVGDTREFRGSDAVYTVSNGRLFQCFCPDTGSEGIQTNWWKVASLSQTEINDFTRQGWILVEDGSLWGLDKDPYLAKNVKYICKGLGGIGGGEVLGLASTGSIDSIIYESFLVSIGLGLLLVWLLLRKGDVKK